MHSEENSTAPALSAIVVVPDSYETVRRTIGFLQAQTASTQMEIVIVAPLGEQHGLDESALSCFHSWRLVEVETVGAIGRAFAAGIRSAKAPVVALTEDHSFPDANWAEALTALHREPWAVVGPSMRNGNPDTMLSWADFNQAYSGWAHPISSGAARHLPGHNSSYKRDILLALGDQLEVLMEAESILHRHLTSQGYRLYLEAGTCTSHVNFDSWSSWIPARYHTGRQYAATWAHSWSRPRRVLFTVGSPAIPWIRMWRIQKDVRNSQTPGFLIRSMPILLAGLLIEACGQMMGYAAGAGDSSEKVARYEFHRVDQDAGMNRGA